MSVLIKGIELPESCSDCAVRYEMFCPLRHRFIADEGRRKDCPLVPVPPHGRLIDADALKDLYHYNTHDSDIDKAWTGNIRRSIDNAPTIIPASFENPTKNARYSQDNPAEEGE